ncbi:hypothetical protein [Flaviaesturariibacter aridisoli]|uniref:DUF4834 family protein n=1 Tax=Flaviaesturariibacter aridisoli TaxID=2545761 RepID=A0A4R4E2J8_9BACT|nr:hypothetical protein [Flaviaesturariibacter aridisoli]TCZ69638.1 hypothetical protein E0486_11990 [Flaviaesturariibacter aridisoli]
MFLTFLFWMILGYLAFRFVFGFLVPMIRTTRQVRRSFREMNQRMNDRFGPQGGAGNGTQKAAPSATPAPTKDDYIDFEEIKD